MLRRLSARPLEEVSELNRMHSLILRFVFLFLFLLAFTLSRLARAAELPLVRIAHGAFSEKIAIMWLGVEQGIFRKHGVNVEVINIRSGP